MTREEALDIIQNHYARSHYDLEEEQALLLLIDELREWLMEEERKGE